MAYRRRRGYKRRPLTGRRKWKHYGKKAGSMAYSAYKMAKHLKDVINTEYKISRINYGLTIDYNGYIANLASNISQGVLATQRTGDSCKLQRLTVRGNVYLNSGSARTNQQLRMIWFRCSSGIIPNVTTINNILDPSAVGTIRAPLAKKNDNTTYETKVLYDRTFTVCSGSNSLVHFKMNLPLNYHIHFDAASTTVNTKGLYVLLISDDSTVNGPNIYMQTDVSFTDS